MIYKIVKIKNKKFIFLFLIFLFFFNKANSIENFKAIFFLDNSKVYIKEDYFRAENQDFLYETLIPFFTGGFNEKKITEIFNELETFFKSWGYDGSQENYWIYPNEMKKFINSTYTIDNELIKICPDLKNIETNDFKKLNNFMGKCMPKLIKEIYKNFDKNKPIYRFLKFNKQIDKENLFQQFQIEKTKNKKNSHFFKISKNSFTKYNLYFLQDKKDNLILKLRGKSKMFNITSEFTGYMFVQNNKFNFFSIHCFKKCDENQIKEFDQMISPLIKINEYKNLYEIKKEKDLENIAVAAKGAYNLYKISRFLLLF